MISLTATHWFIFFLINTLKHPWCSALTPGSVLKISPQKTQGLYVIPGFLIRNIMQGLNSCITSLFPINITFICTEKQKIFHVSCFIVICVIHCCLEQNLYYSKMCLYMKIFKIFYDSFLSEVIYILH